ncbi:hypothetical protein ExPUPEC61_01651 [Escherichia coli]|nr:hypothetical protein ExPUPEC61_01651 [Escherichia coli]
MYINITKAIIPHTTNDAARNAKTCHLVDKNSGRTTGIRAVPDTWLIKWLADFTRHNFNQNFSNCEDLTHMINSLK